MIRNSSFYIILILTIGIVSCSDINDASQKKFSKINISQKDKNRKYIETYYPGNYEEEKKDTLVIIEKDTFRIEIKTFTMMKKYWDLVMDNEQEGISQIIHYRDYETNLRISLNDTLTISKSLNKEYFRNIAGEDYLRFSILTSVKFLKFNRETDELEFEAFLSVPGTCDYQRIEYFVNRTGTVRMRIRIQVIMKNKTSCNNMLFSVQGNE